MSELERTSLIDIDDIRNTLYTLLTIIVHRCVIFMASRYFIKAKINRHARVIHTGETLSRFCGDFMELKKTNSITTGRGCTKVH